MEIDHIIGTSSIFNQLKDLIEIKKEKKVFLLGSEGRGKSKILNEISAYLSENNYCCIQLYGDLSRFAESYYPFKLFVERKEQNYNKRVTAIKESIGVIPYVGKAVKALLNDYDFKSNKTKKTIQDVYPFNLHIPFSIHLVSLYKKYKKLIILCDDFDFFDQFSSNYLNDLDQGILDLDDNLNIQFLFSAKSLETNITNFELFKIIQLQPLTENQIGEIINFWSEKKLSKEDLKLIRSTAGSHLHLLKIIANYINENIDFPNTPTVRNFYKYILDSRLRKFKNNYEELKKLFFAVFDSGKKTTLVELICLLGEEQKIKDLIKQSISLDLLEYRFNNLYFSHPIVEEYVKSLQGHPKTSFLNQLSICLKKISPSDYIRRASIEALSENFYKATVLWSLAAIRNMREGNFNEILPILIYLEEWRHILDLKDTLLHFKKCYELNFNKDIENSLFEVEQISNSLPKEILAEKIYLKSMLMAKKIANSPKQDALKIIKQWEDIKEDEPEIWYRLLQVKILIASELAMYELALETESYVVKYFSSRLAFDKNARIALEKLNIFSDVLYIPEIAHKKMLQAESFFLNEVENENFSSVIDLYIVYVNLSGNSLVLNLTDKAINYTHKSLDILERFNEIKFPYPEVAISNFCISLILGHLANIEDIIDFYYKLYKSDFIEENKILIDINYAGLLVMNNQYETAYKILKEASYIPEESVDDGYYYYFYWINFSICLFFLKKHNEAKECVNKLGAFANSISPHLNKYYKKHFQIIEEIVLYKLEIQNYENMKNHFEQNVPLHISPIWERFKLGYLFTDLQIWTFS